MTRDKALETIIVLTLVSLIGYLRFNIKWLIYLPLILLVISILSRKVTCFIGEVWMSFSYYFGIVMNCIIMGILFYIVLTPLSFFQRLTGGNHILKKEKSNSYFHVREHYFNKNDIEKPW